MQKERTHLNSCKKEGDLEPRSEYIHRRTLTKLIYKKLEDVTLITDAQYSVVIENYTELAEIYALVKEYNEIIFSKKLDAIDTWIVHAQRMDYIKELQSYVNGLNADLEAVKNAIQYNYNNGLAEGSVTKIKLIKRIMYGRNSFELLKAKVLLHEYLYCEIN